MTTKLMTGSCFFIRESLTYNALKFDAIERTILNLEDVIINNIISFTIQRPNSEKYHPKGYPEYEDLKYTVNLFEQISETEFKGHFKTDIDTTGEVQCTLFNNLDTYLLYGTIWKEDNANYNWIAKIKK